MNLSFTRLTTILLALLFVAGCATNPVTGDSDLSLYSESWELQVGAQQYAPLRQSQGGDFIVDPGVADYVQQVGSRVAAQSDRELPYEFEVLNSSVPNAWALPGGKIAVNRGLLTELDSEAELAAVLAHEVVHAAARHGAQMQSRATLAQGAIIVGGAAVSAATDKDQYATVAVLGGMIGAQLIQQRHSRDAERESDYYGMIYMQKAGYDPAAAVALQETFVRLSEDRQSGFLDGLFASHPPSPERVENNRRTLAELGAGGRIGRDSHQRAVARLKALEPAYKAHDEGRKALSEGQFDTAMNKAEEALRIESREAQFHALKGDTLASQDHFVRAESAYDAAVARDPGWFYHHLRRGMVREKRGNLEGARNDLSASLKLLQTATGYLYLGNVERASGNRQQAIEYYRVAAQTNTEAGKRAREALNQMGVE